MKVLVATIDTQGKRNNDHFEAPLRLGDRPEVVVPITQLPLGGFADDDDGHNRSLYGVDSYARTTTAAVLDIPPDLREDLISRLEQTLRVKFPDLEIHYRKRACCMFDFMCKVANRCNVGDILEWRDNHETVRRIGLRPKSVPVPVQSRLAPGRNTGSPRRSEIRPGTRSAGS